MQIDCDLFYNKRRISIIPMGFCYPGKGKSGDLPPRPECAELWHARLLSELPRLRLRVLVGKYAQDYYLGSKRRSLPDTVRAWQDCLPDFFPLPHPSPRNIRWFRNHPWFEAEVLPAFRERVAGILTDYCRYVYPDQSGRPDNTQCNPRAII